MNEDVKKWIWWAIPVVVVVAAGIALYYGYLHKQPEQRPQAEVTAPPENAEPGIKHPIASASEQPEQPLPTLEESDAPIQESLNETFGQPIEQFLIPKNIVRNTVVTIDNLTRKKLAVQMRPVKPTPGDFVVERNNGNITLSEQNYDRYAAIVNVLQNTDSKQIAALYRRYYPLLQQSYVDLGYPEGYFNDRLVEVIDHLLATPDVKGPIELTQPGMFYEFADASLEERSAGQKLLIRMGSDNAAVVKDKLRELRAEVTRSTDGQ